MKIKCKRTVLLIWLLVGAAVLWTAAPGYAQTGIRFSAMEVDIWPEYDRPSVLVIYRLTLAPEVSLPVDLTLRIPAQAGDPNAVAARQADGGLFTVAYDRQVSGEWGLITFTATLPELQLEYYDPQLVRQGEARHFEYEWPGGYAIDSLVIQVQQPLGATDLRTAPGLGSGTVGQDGLVYYTAQVGALTTEQSFSLAIDYSKSADTLSAESLSVQPSAPLSESPATFSGQLAVYFPWILGFLGVALIVGGGVWYWYSGRGVRDATPAPRRRRRSSAPADQAVEGGPVYCHQCGKRAGPGDRFCRACGTQLRPE